MNSLSNIRSCAGSVINHFKSHAKEYCCFAVTLLATAAIYTAYETMNQEVPTSRLRSGGFIYVQANTSSPVIRKLYSMIHEPEQHTPFAVEG